MFSKAKTLGEIPGEIQIDAQGTLIASKEVLEKVRFPFFVGKKDGRSIYVLGTNHGLPLSCLQQSVLPYVKEAKFALFEIIPNVLPPEKVYEKLCEMRVLLPEHDEDDNWYRQLSPVVLNYFEKAVKRFFEPMKKLSVGLPPLKKINPEFACMICLMGRRPVTCIDTEIRDMFGENIGALEGVERFDYLKTLKRSLSALESLTLDNLAISDGANVYPFHLAITKRNFRWIHKIIQTSHHSQEPILVVVGVAHLNGPTGIIALLNRFGYDFHVMQDGYLQPYALSSHPINDFDGNLLLANIDVTIAYKINEIFSSVFRPSTRNIIFGYLSFSIFPEYSKTLSEQIEVAQNENDERPVVKLKF